MSSDRRSRSRRLRPELVALEGRALLSGSAHHAPKVSKPAHAEAQAPLIPAPPTIHSLNDAGGYRFLNFDGPTPPPGATGVFQTNINGIANSGKAVGFVIDANGKFYNFVVNPTKTAKASLLAFEKLDGAAMALGINKAGEVVGTDGNGQAFVLKGKLLKGFIPPGATSAIAFGVNDKGTIVGQDTVGTMTPGFIQVNSKTYITINAPLGPNVVNAQGINNNGLVVGFYVGTDNQDHGFIANQKSAKGGILNSTAVADPTIPAVAGEPGATFVFSQILGVNDKGIAVGYYGDSTTSQHGFLYNTKTGQYKFLDDPAAAFNNGVEVTQITGITNSGEITGFYTDANGNAHGFVATT